MEEILQANVRLSVSLSHVVPLGHAHSELLESLVVDVVLHDNWLLLA